MILLLIITCLVSIIVISCVVFVLCVAVPLEYLLVPIIQVLNLFIVWCFCIPPSSNGVFSARKKGVKIEGPAGSIDLHQMDPVALEAENGDEFLPVFGAHGSEKMYHLQMKVMLSCLLFVLKRQFAKTDHCSK